MFLKRLFDLCLVIPGLFVSLPVLAVIAVAIRLDARGPILFRQVRVGRDGRPFTMYKFRTMVPDAEDLLPALAHLNEGGEYLIKIPNDPRITAVAKSAANDTLGV